MSARLLLEDGSSYAGTAFGHHGPVAGEVVTGRVVNLKKSLSLGSISGPAFEAELDTARGSGKVRYLLTRQGLELMGVTAPAPRREYLN